MVRYDTECTKCGEMKEVIAENTRKLGKCKCGGRREWVPTANVATFKPFVHEHLGHKPVLIESWQQYRRILKANNLVNELAS